MSVVPKSNLIYVIPLEDDKTTESGLYLAETAQQRCDQGIVKYVGSNVTDIKIGNHVLFGGYVGTRMAFEGEGILIIMAPDDVLAIVNDDPPIYLFTSVQVLRFIEQACSIAAASHDPKATEAIRARLESYVIDHFTAEAVMF